MPVDVVLESRVNGVREMVKLSDQIPSRCLKPMRTTLSAAEGSYGVHRRSDEQRTQVDPTRRMIFIPLCLRDNVDGQCMI
jgi:hypothetical protein